MFLVNAVSWAPIDLAAAVACCAAAAPVLERQGGPTNVSFQFVARGRWQPGEKLEPGQVAINVDGRLVLRVEDLALVKIDKSVALLADPSTLRLAIRKPRDEIEAAGAMRVTPITRKSGAGTGRAGVSAARGIKALALTPAACKGRYTLTTKDDLLIVSLAGISAAGKSKTK